MPLSNSIIFRSRWFFWLLISAIVILGALLSLYVHSLVNRTNLESLGQGSQLIASSIDVSEIKTLSGTEEDLNNPDYLTLKSKLMKLRAVENSVRFIYLTGMKDGKVFFYVDSESSDSEDYSPPGQIYEEADQSFYDAFQNKFPNVTGPTTDRWGTWITALAPIVDPETNEVVALVGMDMDASKHLQSVWANTSIPILVTLLLITLGFIGQRISRHEEQMLELKSEFISIASHELRSPLNGIAWAIDSISKASNLTEPQNTIISEIKSTAGNLMGNINDILNASSITGEKKTKLTFEPVDITVMLRQIAAQQSLSAKEKNIVINLEKLPVGNQLITADREKIKRVFNNILSNAIKYSPTNSSVEITFQPMQDQYIISISDHGMGIPENEQSKIFDGYFRAKNAVSSGVTGTGLGLYFAKKIVEVHKGKIWIKSKESAGTTVFIQLPFKS